MLYTLLEKKKINIRALQRLDKMILPNVLTHICFAFEVVQRRSLMRWFIHKCPTISKKNKQKCKSTHKAAYFCVHMVIT